MSELENNVVLNLSKHLYRSSKSNYFRTYANAPFASPGGAIYRQ